MARNVATPKQTAGGGFSFEDKVCAYFAVWLLKGGSPLLPDCGPLVRLDFQNRVDGWFLDDVLVTTQAASVCHCHAFSVKSNVQFTKDAAPAEFVRDVWEQFLHEGTGKFSREQDFLGLITGPQPNPPRADIQKILAKARQQDPILFWKRMLIPNYASDIERKLLESFACPGDLRVKHSVAPECVGTLLKCVMVLDFDFEDSPSQAESLAVSECQSLTSSGTQESGAALWQAILAAVNAVRISGGTLQREGLLAKLRSSHALRDLADFLADWDRLRFWAAELRDSVRTCIGTGVSLPRKVQREEIASAISESPAVAIIGPSGSGKSTLTKLATESCPLSPLALWLSADFFRQNTLDSLQGDLGLQHPLTEILGMLSKPQGLIVIDGIERLTTQSAFSQVGRLLRVLTVGGAEGSWRLVVTCQDEHWDRVLSGLMSSARCTQHWRVVQIQEPKSEELGPVWEEYPSLRALVVRPHLGALLRRPQILDLLASRIESTGDLRTANWVGESDLIRWYWENIVRAGQEADTRSVFLQRLAERQADEGLFATPLADFASADVQCVSGLCQGGVCRRVDETIAFAHDLYGDWARQRSVLAQSARLTTYLGDRVMQPHWHRAIRLYGLHLIEQHSDTVEWEKALRNLEPARDLLLEAIVFAANAEEMMARVWPVMVAHNGNLLTSFLKRLLHVGTFPNPQAMALAKEDSSDAAYMRTVDRIPFWPYWPPLIRALHAHKEDVSILAPVDGASVALKWLRFTEVAQPCHREAAELALVIGEKLYSERLADTYRDKDPDRDIYRAAMLASDSLPERAAALALKACARRTPNNRDPREEIEFVSPTEADKRSRATDASAKPVLPEPWPDGPYFQVDRAFRRACLETEALVPLMRSRPEIAREVILALVISKRREDFSDRYGGGSIDREEDVEVENIHGFGPRFYTQGPFLNFLRVSPTMAAQTVIDLVNFATERWADNVSAEGQAPFELLVDWDGQQRTLLGDYKVFYWYRGVAWFPPMVASALMALEKWVYDSLKDKEEISPDVLNVLDAVIVGMKSTAFIGLLCEFGRFRPSLFKDLFKHLLTVREIYDWEAQYFAQGSDRLGTPLFGGFDQEWFVNLSREWDGAPHRKAQILNIALSLNLQERSMASFFDIVRRNWQTSLARALEGSYEKLQLENLVTWFDRKNWKTTRLPDGQIAITCHLPDELEQKRRGAIDASAKQVDLLTFPMRCRMLLSGQDCIEEVHLEEFWGKVISFAGESSISDGGLSSLDAACGGVAVLVKLHREWLRRNPARETLCREVVVKSVVEHMCPRAQFAGEGDLCDYRCEHFAAEIVPILWAEEPTSNLWPQLVLLLSRAWRYKTVQILMHSLYRTRADLGPRFGQTINLLLRWAVIRFELPNPNSIRKCKLSAEAVDAWIDRESEQFLRGNLPCTMPRWGEEAVTNGELWSAGRRIEMAHGSERPGHVLMRLPRIDIPLVQHAFDGILLPEQAGNPDERGEWINFWNEVLTYLLGSLNAYNENGVPVVAEKVELELPYETDRWSLEKLAIVSLQLEVTEEPRRYWEPILRLGARAHYFVEGFLHDWIFAGIQTTGSRRQQFLAQWQEMVAYADASPAWSGDRTRAHNVKTLWRHLLGFEGFFSNIWGTEHQDLIAAMKPRYLTWARDELSDRWGACSFFAWLQSDAAAPVRLAVLPVIRDTAKQAHDSWWREDRLALQLATVMDICWRKQRDDILIDRDADRAFKELLQLLSTRQQPLALDLQDRVAAHR